MAKEIKNAGALGSQARLEESCPRQNAWEFELIHLPPPWTPVYRLGQFEYASLFMLEEAISVASWLLARFRTTGDLEVPRVGGRSGKGTMVERVGRIERPLVFDVVFDHLLPESCSREIQGAG